MSDDPLKLSSLDPESIDQAVKARSKKTETMESKLRAETNAKREERLQKGGSAGPSTAPPPLPAQAPDPVKDKSKLLDKLGNYRERFPHLKSRNKLSGKSTIEEIEDELHYVEQQLGTQGGNMSGSVFIAAMAGVEHISVNHFNPLNLNLTGLATVCRDNITEVQPILDELLIKYGASMYVSPEMRLVSVVGMMMYTVHAANSGDASTAQAMQKMSAAMKPVKTDL